MKRLNLNAILDSGWFWGLVVGLMFCFLFMHWCDAGAQNVTRKGNVFIQNSSSNKIKKDSLTLTGYFYMTSDGTKYPIYMSSSGKCFIIRISKSGRQYRQYLPEVTKQLNPNVRGGK